MALGPTLGTGVFIAPGQALAVGGPGSLLISYIFSTLLVYCMAVTVAEVAAHRPVANGTIVTHGYRYVSRSFGFSLAYLRWVSFSMLVPYEITTALVSSGLLEPGNKVAMRIALVILIIIGFNFTPERIFRRLEKVSTVLTLLTIITMLAVSVILCTKDIPGGPMRGFHYWTNPGAMNSYLFPGALGRFVGLFQTLLFSTMAFAFTPEMIVNRGEGLEPSTHPNIMHIARRDVFQFAAVHLLVALAVGIIVPSNDPNLLHRGSGPAGSPFIIAMKNAKIGGLPTVISMIMTFSSVASGRSFLFLSSRALLALSESGHAPAILQARTSWGVPYVAVLTSAVFANLAWLCLRVSSSTVFNWLGQISTTMGYLSWLCSCIIYLHFHRTVERRYRSRIQPYGAYIAIFLCSMLLVLNGVSYFVWTNFTLARMTTAYIGLVPFGFLYAGHYFHTWMGGHGQQSAEKIELQNTSSVAITHSTTDSYPVTVPLKSPALANGAVASKDVVFAEDEEPYTIKCICDYDDDDGNTVFCEACETWQHIECYYYGREVPEVHNCAECEPRPYDGRRATERQRRLREQQNEQHSDGGDRRSKSKSQKKKTLPLVNAPVPARKRSGSSAISPTTMAATIPPTPSLLSSASSSSLSGPAIPRYAPEFLHLYDHDAGATPMDSNLYASLSLTNDFATWLHDPIALADETNGRRPHEVYTWSDEAMDQSRWPRLAVETITHPPLTVDGPSPTWKLIRTHSRVRRDEIVGEIQGKVGRLRDYCRDPANRWPELQHPQPFVFFHSQLPIYIDSRQEGSLLRYVRRSCRPNVTLKIYITNQVDYRFCFVAKDDIPPNAEITVSWYLSPALHLANDFVKPEGSDSPSDYAVTCFSKVLANFGGCACSDSHHCLVSKLDRRRQPKLAVETGGRAGSESTKNLDDEDPPVITTTTAAAAAASAAAAAAAAAADGRSTSGSVRGQTRSRDLTPTIPSNPHDVSPSLAENGLSARDRRKIAAVEKKFQQLEQDQQTAQRKKKRSSGHSTQTASTSARTDGGYFGTAGSKRLDTGSPSHRSASNTPVRTLGYVHRAIQTDPTEYDTRFVPSPSASVRRPSFVSLSQRLLRKCHHDRFRSAKMWTTTIPQPTIVMPMTPVQVPPSGDIEMQDVDSPTERRPLSRDSDMASSIAVSQEDSRPVTPVGPNNLAFPAPLPSTVAHHTPLLQQHQQPKTANGSRTDLRIPIPQPHVGSSATAPTTVSPRSTTPSTTQSVRSAQSPSITMESPSVTTSTAPPGSSSITGPSPAKKKLSLGDYLIRKGMTTPTSEKTQAQATAMLPPAGQQPQQPQQKSPAASASAPNGTGSVDAKESMIQPQSSGVVDVPMKDVPETTRSPQVPSVS
ncbi:hypothetical protein ASPZODRAFT_152173 [Penicilliopsis zonata CBS 506.65]|uniref:SET domain-containing protein n=1 Tax=Penicilliopsis zonata CBS 506.65 TaxID=1073090 RepID=A0A1L9SHQ2_9EURO|nr:hypothetical protein ASPZODRAFT_152173 [Penicilliopsis zonata CBS 506.65]OJJ46750.1 hypothetical protein ASPZODRAFT_152173 [Penicilliopsis zonata CBS 506.65]